MAIFFICVAFAFAILGFVALAHDLPYLGILAIVFVGLSYAASIYFMNNEEKNPQERIVVTATPPQIDTTVTIINGVADTTYTYHFYDYEKIK